MRASIVRFLQHAATPALIALVAVAVSFAGYRYVHHLQDVLPPFVARQDGPPFDQFHGFLARNPHIVATRVSADPPIWIFDHFLSDTECDHLRRIGELYMRPSRVAPADRATKGVLPGRVLSPSRTSYSASIPPAITATVRRIEMRLHSLTGVPLYHGEPILLIRYEVGQKYLPHYDWFPLSSQRYIRKGGNRLATILLYLTDAPPAGGETSFPVIPWTTPGTHFDGADEYGGGAVFPKKGRALLWYNMNPVSGETDRRTLHQGREVTNGTKWVATRWIHRKMFLPL